MFFARLTGARPRRGDLKCNCSSQASTASPPIVTPCKRDGHQTTCAPKPRKSIWPICQKTQSPSFQTLMTRRPGQALSSCPTAPWCRACQAFAARSGIAASAATSACDGNPAPKPCHRPVPATSAMPLCRGDRGRGWPPRR